MTHASHWDVWYVVREDGRGLYVEGRLADTTRGRDVYELVKMKAIKGLSIEYGARNFKKNQIGGRDLFDVDLYEISAVSFASCPNAEIDSVKTQSRLESAVERLCKALDGLRVPHAPAPNAPEASMAWRMAMTEQQQALQQPHGRW
jgi:phage head maturation protease